MRPARDGRTLLRGAMLLLLPVALSSCAGGATVGGGESPSTESPSTVSPRADVADAAEVSGGPVSPAVETRKMASAEGPIELTAAPRRIRLDFSKPDTDGVQDLGKLLASREPGQRLILQVRDLQAAGPPGVLYHLYLGLPAGETPAQDDFRHVGSIQFFDAVPSKKGFYSFDVTEVLQRLQRQAQLDLGSVVTVIPAGAPETGAQPAVGRIDLVVESP